MVLNRYYIPDLGYTPSKTTTTSKTPTWNPFAPPQTKYSPSNPAPYGQGAGVLKPEYGGGVNINKSQTQTVWTAPTNPGYTYDPGAAARKAAADAAAAAAAAQAKANKEGKARSKKENDATRALADAQHKLFGQFGKQRDTKLGNITKALQQSDKLLLENYGSTLKGLEGNRTDNEKSESDASFSNVANAVRERTSLLEQAGSLGAGESDLLRAQLQALRNYGQNQSEINRSFYDTLRSVNNSLTSLNADTATSRVNLFQQAEADRESAWANFYNQTADTWTQIQNIENSNTNIDSDSSTAYDKKYGSAADEAAKATGSSYARKDIPAGYTDWNGKGAAEDRRLRSNQAAAVTIGAQKAPEGATLRKW